MAEAVAAIYRAIAAGTERYGCVGSAIAADDGEAFALASAESAAASAAKVVTRLASPSVPARNTSFGIVGEASRGVEFLLAYGEEKLCSTVAAFKGHVGKGHGSSSGLVGNHGAHARSVSSGTAITIPKDRGPAQFRSHYYTCIVNGKQRFSPPESENHRFRRRLGRRTPSGVPHHRVLVIRIQRRKPGSSARYAPGIPHTEETPRRKQPRAERARRGRTLREHAWCKPLPRP